MNYFKKIFLNSWCLLLIFQSSCDSSVEKKKNAVDMYIKNSNHYYKDRQYNKAIQNYNKVIELTPNNTGVYYYRGKAHYNLKQYDKAIVDFTHAIKLNTKDYRVYYYRGLSYCRVKQYDKAVSDFTHAIKLNSKNSRLYYNRGLTYVKLKQYDKAIMDLSHVIKLNPKSEESYYFRGVAYTFSKQYKKAIIDLSHTIKLNPKSERVYHARGLAYFFAKQYDKAIQDFSMLNDVYAYFGLANVYCKLKQYDKALINYSKVIELDKFDIGSYLNMMEICIIAGKTDQFNHWLKQFEKNIPEDKLSRSDLVIKFYLILLNKYVMNESVVDIEKRLNTLLKNKGEIDSNWSFELTDEWLKNPKNGLTPKQIKHIQNLTKKVKDVFEKDKKSKKLLNEVNLGQGKPLF